MNAHCKTCDSWVSGSDIARNQAGEIIRDPYGNAMRTMECGHEIAIEDDDSDLPRAGDARESNWFGGELS